MVGATHHFVVFFPPFKRVTWEDFLISCAHPIAYGLKILNKNSLINKQPFLLPYKRNASFFVFFSCPCFVPIVIKAHRFDPPSGALMAAGWITLADLAHTPGHCPFPPQPRPQLTCNPLASPRQSLGCFGPPNGQLERGVSYGHGSL